MEEEGEEGYELGPLFQCWAGRRVVVVCFEGLIGAGKTYTMRCLQEHNLIQAGDYHVVYVYEPVALWEKMGVLQEFYANREDNAFPFQEICYHTHIRATLEALSKVPQDGKPILVLSERGVYTQLLFWTKQYEEKKLRSAQKMHNTAYMMIFDMFRCFIPEPSGFIYLVTDVDLAMERLNNRERDKLKCSMPQLAEDAVAAESKFKDDAEMHAYQEKLYELHQRFFTTPTARPPRCKKDIPCMHLQTGEEPLHMSDGSLQRVAKQVMQFISPLLIRGVGADVLIMDESPFMFWKNTMHSKEVDKNTIQSEEVD